MIQVGVGFARTRSHIIPMQVGELPRHAQPNYKYLNQGILFHNSKLGIMPTHSLCIRRIK